MESLLDTTVFPFTGMAFESKHSATGASCLSDKKWSTCTVYYVKELTIFDD